MNTRGRISIRQQFPLIAVALAGLVASQLPVGGHTCDVQQINLTVGEACPWRITADRTETTTLYTPVLSGPAGIVNITPRSAFQAHHGDFVIRGLAPGTNDLIVTWFYPGTPAAGVCTVKIIVTAPVPGQSSFQTNKGHGQLCTAEFGKYIESRTLRSMLDYYVPAPALKLIVLTECFGGNVAQSPSFANMTNTAIASGTSPNQEGRTGGYPDDAAGALKPSAGRTAADVHHAGTVGRQTVEQVDNPTNDKEGAFVLSEWPTTGGGLSLASFPLDPVTAGSAIESRHVVVYCGNPIAKNIAVETHGGATIPSIDGQKMAFGDAKDRDTIKQNFAGQPNTTVTTAGGPPAATDRKLGQNGWDYAGTLAGLEAAIKQAGDAIRNSPRPQREQFILFVGDHGMLGTLGNTAAPRQPSTPNSRSEVAPSFQSFASTEPAAFFMEQDASNVPGFLLFLEFPETSRPIPDFSPGQLELQFQSATVPAPTLREFVAAAADVNGDSLLGGPDGEGLSLFFPVNEQTFFSSFLDRQFDIFLVNQSPHTFTVTKLEQVTGSIEPGWTPAPRPKIVGLKASAQGGVEFVLQGSRSRTYLIERSTDLRNWEMVTQRRLDNVSQVIQDVPGAGAAYYRAQLLNP